MSGTKYCIVCMCGYTLLAHFRTRLQHDNIPCDKSSRRIHVLFLQMIILSQVAHSCVNKADVKMGVIYTISMDGMFFAFVFGSVSAKEKLDRKRSTPSTSRQALQNEHHHPQRILRIYY